MEEKNIVLAEEDKTAGEVLGECLQWLCSPRGANNFFGRVMSLCSRIERKGLKTAGVSLDLRGGYVYTWDPEWFMTKSRAFQHLLLIHEASHLVFNHVGEMLKIAKDINDPARRRRWWEVMNIAADMAANDVALRHLISDSRRTFIDHKDEFIWPESKNYEPNKTFEHYFKRLTEDLKSEGYSPNDEPKVIQLTIDKDGKLSLKGGAAPGQGEEGTDPSSAGGEGGEGSEGGEGEGKDGGSGSEKDTQEDDGTNKPEWYKQLLDKTNYAIDVTEIIDQMSNSEIERAVSRSESNSAKISAQAARETKKSRGTVPGCVEEMIAESLKEPTLPWRDVLRTMIRSGLANKLEPSLVSPNPAFLHLVEEGIEPYPGYQHEFSTRIAIGVDTSGSVSNEEFVDFLSEVHGIVGTDRGVELFLIMFDHAMQDERRISDDMQSDTLTVEEYSNKRYGYGGTSFEPFLKYVCNIDTPDDWIPDAHRVAQRPSSFDMCLIFTDGYAPIGVDEGGPIPTLLPKCPLIWVLTPTGKKDDAMEPRILRITS